MNDLLEKKDISSSDQPEIVVAKKRLKAVLDRCK
jgi:hypothetical protein